MHWRDSFKPVHHKDLSAKQLKQILESRMIVVQKKDGTVKAREVLVVTSNESSCRKKMRVHPLLLLNQCCCRVQTMLESKDRQPCSIQTRVKRDKDKAIIRIRGLVVDMLVEIAPEVYSEYVTKDKRGNTELLVICLNALYGTMVAALLFYQKFCNSLLSKGFVKNPYYDRCVWNKDINGKQLTIVFHVDDCKLSHVNSKVLYWTILLICYAEIIRVYLRMVVEK